MFGHDDSLNQLHKRYQNDQLLHLYQEAYSYLAEQHSETYLFSASFDKLVK
jgi:hypothetical protein